MFFALCYFASIFVSIGLIRLGFWLDSSNATTNWDAEYLQLWFFFVFVPGFNVLLPLLAVLYLTFGLFRRSFKKIARSSHFFNSFIKHLLLPRNYHKK